MTSTPFEQTVTEPTWRETSVPRNEFAQARAAERVRTEMQNDRATRVVAGNAVDAEDCRSLLMMLGLTGGVDGTVEDAPRGAPGRL